MKRLFVVILVSLTAFSLGAQTFPSVFDPMVSDKGGFDSAFINPAGISQKGANLRAKTQLTAPMVQDGVEDGYPVMVTEDLNIDMSAAFKMEGLLLGGRAAMHIDFIEEVGAPDAPLVSETSVFLGLGLPITKRLALGALVHHELTYGEDEEGSEKFLPEQTTVSAGVIFGKNLRFGIALPALYSHDHINDNSVSPGDENFLSTLAYGFSTELDLKIIELMVGAETNALQEVLYSAGITEQPEMPFPNFGLTKYARTMIGLELLWIFEARLQYVQSFNPYGESVDLYGVGIGCDLGTINVGLEMLVNEAYTLPVNENLTGFPPYAQFDFSVRVKL